MRDSELILTTFVFLNVQLNLSILPHWNAATVAGIETVTAILAMQCHNHRATAGAKQIGDV